MRWPWSTAAAEPVERADLARLDGDDLARLEVIELDGAGRWVGARRQPATEPMHELAYGPARDGTGLAGIWEALADR